jgi:eukaryotic-like serine/threonine-protein kinase
VAGFPEVAGFRVFEQIGQGGFATVFLAEQLSLGRNVALKVLRNVELNSDDIDTFRRECKALMSIPRHPNIVQIFDAGTSVEGRPYIAMEYVPGRSLRDVTADRRLSDDEVARVGEQIGEALAAVHAAGVVHRDVKPANVLVGADGQYLLGDFGVSSAFQSTRSSTRGLVGTPDYLAPEIVRGSRASARSDVYALGVTLYQLASGRSPFGRETDESISAVLLRIVQEDAADVRSFGVPEWLASTIDVAMCKEPEQRFASGTELARALRGRVVVEPPTIRRIAPVDTPTLHRAALADASVSGQSFEVHGLDTAKPSTSRRKPALLAAVAAAVVLAGTGAAVMAKQGGTKTSTSTPTVLPSDVTNATTTATPTTAPDATTTTTTPATETSSDTAIVDSTASVAPGTTSTVRGSTSSSSRPSSTTTSPTTTTTTPTTTTTAPTTSTSAPATTTSTTMATTTTTTTTAPLPPAVRPSIGAMEPVANGDGTWTIWYRGTDPCTVVSFTLSGPTPFSWNADPRSDGPSQNGCWSGSALPFRMNTAWKNTPLASGTYTATLFVRSTKTDLTNSRPGTFTVP